MAHHDRTILVLGATGRQGGAEARALQSAASPSRALTRDPDKPGARALTGGATVVKGDLDDTLSLREAMNGVDGVFSVQTPYGPSGDARARARAGMAVADAARLRALARVYSSSAAAERKTGSRTSRASTASRSTFADRSARDDPPPGVLHGNFAGPAGPREIAGELVLRLALPPERKLQLIAVRTSHPRRHCVRRRDGVAAARSRSPATSCR